MPIHEPPAYTPITPLPGDPALPDGLTREWLAHYEAGRLTPRQPIPSEILSILEHNDALFRARARAQRHAAEERGVTPGGIW